MFTLFPSPDKNQTELGGVPGYLRVPGCSRTVLHTVVGNSLPSCRFMSSCRLMVKLMVRESGSLVAVLSFSHLNQKKHLAYTT